MQIVAKAKFQKFTFTYIINTAMCNGKRVARQM